MSSVDEAGQAGETDAAQLPPPVPTNNEGEEPMEVEAANTEAAPMEVVEVVEVVEPPPTPVEPAVSTEMLSLLAQMGFPRNRSVRALHGTNSGIEQAIAWFVFMCHVPIHARIPCHLKNTAVL